MVIHRPASYNAWRTLRSLGVALAGVVGTVAGTAVLIAAFSSSDGSTLYDAQGKPVTVAELVMQSSTERALVSPQMATLASRSVTDTNDRRGM